VLGTAYHEVDKTMQPIEEHGKGKGHPYGIPGPERHQVYCGRGSDQLTWVDNYQKLGDEIGVDLLDNPEKALELDVACKVIFIEMIDGDFTGEKLSDYFNSRSEGWLQARRIVNGLNRAAEIEGYGKNFYASISYTVA
jgi:putative chitinase